MSAAEESSRPPRQVGVYRLEARIGSGAMGTVYRATHMTLGKEVALKIVQAEDPQGELCRRFLQEGIAASRVRHPNVVEVLDAGRHDDTAYLAMQLLDGETLAECLARQGRLPVTYAIDLILPVCAALIAAHQAGVLHRDLKPANIFLSDVGRGEPEPMLLDFGISKILGPIDSALTQNPRFLGTPLYIAPEQADGAPGSHLSDQYSLALSLYECLLGVRPYQKYASSLIQLLRRVAEGEIQPPRDLDASIPEELDEAICRALSVNPLDRFPSLREFGAALLPFASSARGTLWQHSFIDAERTMTSVSSPISNSRNSRRVRVSVSDDVRISPLPKSPPADHLRSETEDDDSFMSHSALFGHAEFGDADFDNANSERRAHSRSRGSSRYSFEFERSSDSEPSDSRDAQLRRMERSSISRRSLPQIRKSEPEDPYSQLPSGRPHVESWSDRGRDEPRSFHHPPSSWLNPPPKTSKLAWFFAGLLVLATLTAAVTLIRFDLGNDKPTSHYPVELKSIPDSARIYLDGLQVGTGSFRAKFAKDGVLHRIRVAHPDFEETVVAFQDEAPPRSIRLRPLEQNPIRTSLAGHDSTQPPTSGNSRTSRPAPQRTIQNEQAPPSSPGSSPETFTAKNNPSNLAEPLTSQKVSDDKTLANQAASNAGPTAPQAKALETNPAQGNQVPASPPKTTPASSNKEKSIQTGNLDPWSR